MLFHGGDVHYLRTHTLGSIIRSAVIIYKDNFLTIFLAVFFIEFPVFVAYDVVADRTNTIYPRSMVYLNTLVMTFTTAVVTVLVSEICLGRQPKIGPAYKKAGDILGSLIWVGFLYGLVVMLGLICFVIPGILAASYMTLYTEVLVLEGKRGSEALKGSFQLTKGSLLFVLVAMLFALGSAVFLPAIMSGLLDYAFGLEDTEFISLLLFNLLLAFMRPLMIVTTVLIYYSLRSQRSFFDAEILAEELRR
jgi:hypothetical protein